MSWIESHQKLKDEPKLFDLMIVLNLSKAEAIGRLHMFWWWCVDHAEDGDLSKFNDAHLALAVELNPCEGKKFIEALTNAGFLEREPYFRIRNWWKYIKRFLQQRYKDYPDKWRKIEKLYTVSVTDTVTDTVNQETNQPTNQPNITKPTNQPPSLGLDCATALNLEKRLVELGLKSGIVSKYRHDDIAEILRIYDTKIKKGETFKNPQGWILSELKKLDTSDIAEDKITAMIEILKTGEAYARGNCPPPGKTLRQYVIEKLRRNGKKD